MTASEGVRQAMLRFYELFSAGDVDGMAGHITQGDDALVLGSDWDQWSEGRDAWVDGFRTQVAEMPGLRFEAGERLVAHEEGTIGWAADQPSIVLPDGSAIPVRATAVLRREDDGWKLVSLHVSFGVPDARLEELLPLLLG